jgi:predicted secreted protein
LPLLSVFFGVLQYAKELKKIIHATGDKQTPLRSGSMTENVAAISNAMKNTVCKYKLEDWRAKIDATIGTGLDLNDEKEMDRLIPKFNVDCRSLIQFYRTLTPEDIRLHGELDHREFNRFGHCGETIESKRIYLFNQERFVCNRSVIFTGSTSDPIMSPESCLLNNSLIEFLVGETYTRHTLSLSLSPTRTVLCSLLWAC